MAPVGMVGMLDCFSSPEVGIISLVVFLILSVALVGLCASCHRNSSNAYDVSGSKTDGGGGANGAVGTKTGGTSDSVNWRSHKDMPASTLERPHASTN